MSPTLHKTPPPSITWPLVVLVAIILGAFVGIFALIPESDPTSRSALLAVVTAAGNAVVLFFVSRSNRQQSTEIERVKRLVNGHTTAILAKIPDPVERAEAEQAFRLLVRQDLAEGNHD